MIEKDEILFSKTSALNTILLIDLCPWSGGNDLLVLVSSLICSALYGRQWFELSISSSCKLYMTTMWISSVKKCKHQRKLNLLAFGMLKLTAWNSKIPMQSDRVKVSASDKKKFQEVSHQYLTNAANSSDRDMILTGVFEE